MHTFVIDGIAAVSIPTALPGSQLQELLRTLHAIRVTYILNEHAFHAENTEAGRALSEAAKAAGFTIGAPLKL
jgi:hypothetical protein